MNRRGSKKNRKRILFIILNVTLTVLALVCFSAVAILTGILSSQKTAERWRGESDMAFSQVSCYIPVDAKLSISDIYKFRTDMQTKQHEAALDAASENRLYVDAWSTTGKVKASTAIGSGDASVIAVGGEFFNFHPLRLLSGSYISESDLMQDRVLLDPNLAWLLFGGTDLQGMEMRINGIPFMVAGVIEREEDFASQKAYTSGMGLYMSYEAYAQLSETAGISCYELVAAEPVEGFTKSMVQEIFPIGEGEIVENSSRYSVMSLLNVLRNFGRRSMHTSGVIYPYWENAARLIEDWSTLLLFLGLLALLLPVATVLVILVRRLHKGIINVQENVLPKLADGAQEAVRVRQRRAWEKKQAKYQNKH